MGNPFQQVAQATVSRDQKAIQKDLDGVEGQIKAYGVAKMSPRDTAPLLEKRVQLRDEMARALAGVKK